MSRLSNFLIFFGIMIAVFGGIHYYLYSRLVVLPRISPPWSLYLKWTLLLLAMTPPAAFILIRTAEGSLGRISVAAGMLWMGLMFILFVHTLTFDSLRAGGWLAEKIGLLQPLDDARRLFFYRIGAASVGTLGILSGAWGMFKATGNLIVVTVDVPIKGLPIAFDGYTIVQLSDVHLGPTQGQAWMKKVVQVSNEIKPDLVAITGDLVDGSVDQLRQDVAPLADLKSKDGSYFVTGNHEYYFDAGAWIKHLPTLGIRVLSNERITLKRKRASLDLAGVGDQTGLSMPPYKGTNIAAALKGKAADRRSILLAHQPRVAEEASQHGVDLVLAGHTHGGQIWPFHYLVYLQQPYLKGLNNHKGTQVYVSQGTGTWGPPIRIGTVAELTKIVLRSA